MPYTGFDPYGPEPDPSGGGLDPSFYYAASPGGRFPGDEQNRLEWQAAHSRGTAGGNPDYDVPDWATRLGKFGRLLGLHERNAQQGGEGQEPGAVGGYPYHFFSGPGASYGPPGGPLHGLVDQGRPGDPWDGADRPEYVPQDTGSGKKKHGGGGGGGGFNFAAMPAYQGIQHQGSFVDWQPTQPFGAASGPTRFVPGQGSSTPRPIAAPAAGGAGKPGVGGQRGAGGGGVGGVGGGAGPGKGRGGKGAGTGAGTGKGKPGKLTPGSPRPNGSGNPLDSLLAWLTGRDRVGPGGSLRDSIGGGVDPNNLDMGTPGWMRDPTSGVHNTGGFPGATPFAPNPGENFDSYLTRLHDAGFDSGSIGGMLGPNGFKQNDQGGWEWGWGTGPVVRGADGYQFANQGPSFDVHVGGSPQDQTPWYHQGTQGGRGGGGGAGGRAGGAGNTGPGGGGEKPNAADYIAGGVFNLPAI